MRRHWRGARGGGRGALPTLMERMLTAGLRRVLCEPVAELPEVNSDSRFKNDVSAAAGARGHGQRRRVVSRGATPSIALQDYDVYSCWRR